MSWIFGSQCIIFLQAEHLNSSSVSVWKRLKHEHYHYITLSLCFVLHFDSFIVLLTVLFVDLVHCILLFSLRLSRPSCNQVVSDCF